MRHRLIVGRARPRETCARSDRQEECGDEYQDEQQSGGNPEQAHIEIHGSCASFV
jgi:hypothetical protein